MITQWEGIYFLLIGKKSQTKKKQQTKSQNNSKQTNKKPRNNINLDLILILNQKKITGQSFQIVIQSVKQL